jgi:thiol-disulfide isomerase/thioredoxin
MEALIASMTADGPLSKRPPQMVLVERLVSGFASLGEDMMIVPFIRKGARLLAGATVIALGGLILTISAQDARAQTADTLCALGKRAAAVVPAASDMLAITPRTERGAPVDLAYFDGDGEERRLSDLRGMVVVLNIWATWCPPCVREMPTLDSLAAQTQDQDVVVLALSQDRGGDRKVPKFYEGAGIENLEVALDPTLAAGKVFGIRGLPTTVILDKTGREVARHEGYREWDGLDVLALLDVLSRESEVRDGTLPRAEETAFVK